MGKTKIKTIDDSSPVEGKEKNEKPFKKKVAKSSEFEAISAVESAPEERISHESASQQTHSEAQTITSEPEFSRPSGASTTDEPPSPKKPKRPGKAKPRSKKYIEASKDLDRSKTYPLAEALDMVKKLSYAKFNATIEAHINTYATGIHGLVSLPFASGKNLRILAFGPTSQSSEGQVKALQALGVLIGNDSTIDEISKGKIDFDLIVTTPEWMPKLAKAARVLGPKGLMPNPKNGTITDPSADGLKKGIESFRAGKTEYKTESKAPIIHMSLGRIDQSSEQLEANIKTLFAALGKSRVKKVSLSPTMGTSVKVDLASI